MYNNREIIKICAKNLREKGAIMTKEEIRDIQEEVTKEVERLTNDEKYLRKVKDLDHPEKINPFVVAILVGKTEKVKSYRSELFNGDHAEYNLFLQKLSGEDHSDDTLFVSLEPCNHDSRLKTISCSELVVKAGIKNVYMGTFDPDPMVRGDGYAYLINNKVKVDLFDEDFHARLIEANKKFYLKKIIDDESFSRFMKKYKNNFDIDSFAVDAVARKNQFEFDSDIGSIFKMAEDYKDSNNNIFESFYNMSKDSHYIDEVVVNSKRDFWFDDGYKLAFYKNPNSFFKGAYFRVISYVGADENASESYTGPLFVSILKVLSRVFEETKKIIPSDKWKSVFRIIREMLVNAACHKNYDSYSPVIIKIKKEVIEIYNPFVKDKIDVEKLNSFEMPTNPVNGCLTDIAINAHFMEGQGRGSADLKKYLQEFDKQNYMVYETVCDILITKIPLPDNEL